LQRAKIENLRIHDLRRTHGSYLAMGGASQYIIGAALGHKSSAATAIYARLSIDPVKEAQEQAAKRMVQLMEGK
jgi:integrase